MYVVEVSSFEFRVSGCGVLSPDQGHQRRGERNYVVVSVAVAASGTLTADDERSFFFKSFWAQCDQVLLFYVCGCFLRIFVLVVCDLSLQIIIIF